MSNLDAVQQHAPRASGRQPGKRAAQRRLADTVAAEDRRHRAFRRMQRHALQYVAVTVVRMDIERIEHGLKDTRLVRRDVNTTHRGTEADVGAAFRRPSAFVGSGLEAPYL